MPEQSGFRIDLKPPGFGGRDIDRMGAQRPGDVLVAVFQVVDVAQNGGVSGSIHGKTVFHRSG